MTVYATYAELLDRISPTYADRAEVTEQAVAEHLLLRASELIDHVTMNRGAAAYVSEEGLLVQPYRETLSKATVDQVEFWLEAGPEHDIAGLTGSVVSGRLQIHPVAPLLGTRAKRTLQDGGLYYAGVSIG